MIPANQRFGRLFFGGCHRGGNRGCDACHQGWYVDMYFHSKPSVGTCLIVLFHIPIPLEDEHDSFLWFPNKLNKNYSRSKHTTCTPLAKLISKTKESLEEIQGYRVTLADFLDFAFLKTHWPRYWWKNLPRVWKNNEIQKFKSLREWLGNVNSRILQQPHPPALGGLEAFRNTEFLEFNNTFKKRDLVLIFGVVPPTTTNS